MGDGWFVRWLGVFELRWVRRAWLRLQKAGWRLLRGGRRAPPSWQEVFEGWMAAHGEALHPRTLDMQRGHARRFAERLPPPSSCTERDLDAYVRSRLGEVKRSTLLKELSTLRQALHWAERTGRWDAPPTVRAPWGRAQGTEQRRHRAVFLEPEEVERVLEKLPERSRSGARPRLWYTLMWETGLRRGTLVRLKGAHWDGVARVLHVPAGADKARYARPVPVSPRAAAVLDALQAEAGTGPLFLRPPHKAVLRRAARAAGIDEQSVAHLSDHDVRRARATRWLEVSRNLCGVAYLLGHRRPSTTDRYARPRYRAAQEVVARAAKTRRGGSGRYVAPAGRFGARETFTWRAT